MLMQGFLDRTFPVLGEEGIEIEALSVPLVAFAGLGGVGGGAFSISSAAGRFRLAKAWMRPVMEVCDVKDH